MNLLDKIFVSFRKNADPVPIKCFPDEWDVAREQALEEIYPECHFLASSINDAFKKINGAMDKFEEAKLREDISERILNIPKEMKENFLKRARKAAKIEYFESMDYDELLEFHSAVMQSLVTLTKITSDNRYIFSFFGHELRDYSNSMKEAAKLAESLRKELDSRKKVVEDFEKVLSDYEFLLSLVSEKENLEKRHSSLANAIVQLEAGNGTREVDDRKLKGFKIEQEKIRDKLSIKITSLERAFRKIQRTCDKGEAQLIERYLEDPLGGFLREEREYPKLKAVLMRMIKMIENNELELKNTERALQIAEGLLTDSAVSLLDEYKKIENEKNLEIEKLKPLIRKQEELKALEEDLSNSKKELAEYGEKLSIKQRDIDEKKRSLEKAFGKLVGYSITLMLC